MNPLTQSAGSWRPTILRNLKWALLALVWLLGHSLHGGAWTKFLGGQDINETWSVTPPIDASGNIFFCSTRGTVVALRSSDGSEVWRTELGGYGFPESLITREGYLITGVRRGERGLLFALEAATGKPVWTNSVSDYYITVGATSPDGVVFATTGSALVAIRSSDGMTLWSTKGGYPGASVSIGHGVVTVRKEWDTSTESSYVDAFDVDTGALRWTLKGASAGAVPSSDSTFVVTSVSKMTVVRATTGIAAWSRVIQNTPSDSSFSFATTNIAFGGDGGPTTVRLLSGHSSVSDCKHDGWNKRRV